MTKTSWAISDPPPVRRHLLLEMGQPWAGALRSWTAVTRIVAGSSPVIDPFHIQNRPSRHPIPGYLHWEDGWGWRAITAKISLPVHPILCSSITSHSVPIHSRKKTTKRVLGSSLVLMFFVPIVRIRIEHEITTVHEHEIHDDQSPERAQNESPFHPVPAVHTGRGAEKKTITSHEFLEEKVWIQSMYERKEEDKRKTGNDWNCCWGGHRPVDCSERHEDQEEEHEEQEISPISEHCLSAVASLLESRFLSTCCGGDVPEGWVDTTRATNTNHLLPPFLSLPATFRPSQGPNSTPVLHLIFSRKEKNEGSNGMIQSTQTLLIKSPGHLAPVSKLAFHPSVLPSSRRPKSFSFPLS